MNILQYPAVFQPEDEGYSVSFPDFPEGFTQGENAVDAFDQAIDCLEEAIANRIALKLEIPSPTAALGLLDDRGLDPSMQLLP